MQYDLRKKLHPSSKKKIDRLFNEWSYVINHKDEMAGRQVSPQTAQVLKKSGYPVTPSNRVFILKEHGDKVRIKNGYVIYERANGDTEKIILPARGDFLRQIERLQHRPLARNELLTLKVGEYRNVNWQFTSFAELTHYVRNANWKSPNVLQYLSLVSVRIDGDEDNENEPIIQRRTDTPPKGRGKKSGGKKAASRGRAGR